MKARKQPPAPVVVVPSALWDQLAQLPSTLTCFDAAQTTVDNFAVELKADPLSAFGHMVEAIDAAADLSVAARVKSLLITHQSASLSPRASAERILALAESKVIESTRGGRLVEAVRDLVERRTTRAWAAIFASLRILTQKPPGYYSDDQDPSA